MRTEEPERRLAPTLFFLTIAVTAVLTLFFVVGYGFAKGDYGMTCIPFSGSPVYPRCVTDINQMVTFGTLALVGFVIMGLGAYLNRRDHSTSIMTVIVMALLGLIALFFTIY